MEVFMDTREVRRCNSLRNAAYNDLCRGAQTSNAKLIDSAANRLSVYGSSPDRIGFSSADIHEHYDRVTEKLNRLNGSLQYSIKELQKYNLKVSRDNGAGNHDNRVRQSLSHDVHELGTDVRILSRIQAVLGTELRRRGEVAAIMVEERHNAIAVSTAVR
jgi:hypothetical protein